METILRLEDAALRRRTPADVLADNMAGFTGTIWFVAMHLAWFGAWAVVNADLVPVIAAFDPDQAKQNELPLGPPRTSGPADQFVGRA